jgi:N-acetylmuramoyl-L-alanine amidase
LLRLRFVLVTALLAVLVAGLGVGASTTALRPFQAQQQPTYTVYAAGSRRTLPYRTEGGTDTVSLEQLASLFQFTVTEDLLVEGVVGGLTVATSGERVLLTPGQSWAQVSGNLRSLSGQVDGEPGAWRVPIDFLSRALGPAVGTAIRIRGSSRLILVGDISVPAVSGRIDQQGRAGQLVLDIQPATPHVVRRNGSRLTIQFAAEALDMGPITGTAPDYIAATRVDGSTLEVVLGPEAASYEADTDRDESRLTVELRAPRRPPPLRVPDRGAPDPPVVDITPPGEIRIVVIDPGHGGSDEGARGPSGLTEKTVTLRAARQLKAEIERRMGLTVLLTREGDDAVTLDRRSALANNFKADLFISLHANSSLNSRLSGAEVVTLSQQDYAARAPAVTTSRAEVAVIGGGTRLIEAVPWDLAQLPHADRSAQLGTVLARHLVENRVPMFATGADRRPLRVLVGANMPAIMIEMGFLSNPSDERAFSSGARRDAITEAVLAAITEIRRAAARGSSGGDPR